MGERAAQAAEDKAFVSLLQSLHSTLGPIYRGTDPSDCLASVRHHHSHVKYHRPCGVGARAARAAQKTKKPCPSSGTDPSDCLAVRRVCHHPKQIDWPGGADRWRIVDLISTGGALKKISFVQCMAKGIWDALHEGISRRSSVHREQIDRIEHLGMDYCV